MTSRSNRDVGWARHGESRRRRVSLRDAKGQVASVLGENKHHGSSFESFLREEGVFEEVDAAARRRSVDENPMPRTSFDDFFDEQMANPKFAEAYRAARAEIDNKDAKVARKRTRVAVDKGVNRGNK